MYGLRREVKSTKTFEIKAAATGARKAFNAGLFKLCGFIFNIAFVVCIRVQKTALIFIYASYLF